MTDKHDKDSTKLREKVARIICCYAEKNNSCAECKEHPIPGVIFPDCYQDIREQTDKLLALIEQAVKVEHDRMIKCCVDEGNDAYKRGVDKEREKIIGYLDSMVWVFNPKKERAEFLGIIQELKTGLWEDWKALKGNVQ